MLNVIIRADASLHIGSGHIMRCLVLAEALKCDGYHVVFATRPQQGDLIALIKQRGFAVYELTQPIHWQKPSSTADYAAWLQLNEDDDADDCASIFNNAEQNIELVITDHYGIGARWHKKIKSIYHCKVLAIDDLVRKHSADLIIDQTLFRNPAEYTVLNPEAKVLTGTQYAIINNKFAKHHLTQLNVERSLSDTPRILLSMGGIDGSNVTLQVLNVINDAFVIKPNITVLLSQRAPYYSQVSAFSQQHSDWVTHINFVDDMAQLMCEHDIAIGAPGSTSWERACIGLPSIIIALAENQNTICQQLAKVNAAISLALQDIEAGFMSAYNQLLNNYQTMRKTNLQLCDGKGVKRIIKQLSDLTSTSHCLYLLRVAKHADIRQVYEWQCEPETRRYALNQATPNWEDHKHWMTNKLSDSNDVFYILELNEKQQSKAVISVGGVRLDYTANNTYTISIFIAPEYFGRGIAKFALKQIDIQHPFVTINAVVLKDNIASQRLFSQAGYIKTTAEHFTRPPVKAKD